MTAADLIARRRACHGTRWCCQHQDHPQCNSWSDPHLAARLRYRARSSAPYLLGWAIAALGRHLPRRKASR